MTHQTVSVRHLPRLANRILEPLPLHPLSLFLARTVRATTRRHSDALARLGVHAHKRFLIDPTDVPFCFLLRPRPRDPRIEVMRRSQAHDWDSRIAGPLAALLGMVHGTFDGDALFFSRDIMVEGDMEALLALRNALDDAEIDLFEDASRGLGLPAPLVDRALRPIALMAGRATGVPVTRAELHR